MFNVHSLMNIMNFIEIFYIFFNFHFFSHSNLMSIFMPIFISKISSVDFLPNFKVVELEQGDLDGNPIQEISLNGRIPWKLEENHMYS